MTGTLRLIMLCIRKGRMHYGDYDDYHDRVMHFTKVHDHIVVIIVIVLYVEGLGAL